MFSASVSFVSFGESVPSIARSLIILPVTLPHLLLQLQHSLLHVVLLSAMLVRQLGLKPLPILDEQLHEFREICFGPSRSWATIPRLLQREYQHLHILVAHLCFVASAGSCCHRLRSGWLNVHRPRSRTAATKCNRPGA